MQGSDVTFTSQRGVGVSAMTDATLLPCNARRAWVDPNPRASRPRRIARTLVPPARRAGRPSRVGRYPCLVSVVVYADPGRRNPVVPGRPGRAVDALGPPMLGLISGRTWAHPSGTKVASSTCVATSSVVEQSACQ